MTPEELNSLRRKFKELTGKVLPNNYNAADIMMVMQEFCGEERYKEFIRELSFEMYRSISAPSIYEFINMFYYQSCFPS